MAYVNDGIIDTMNERGLQLWDGMADIFGDENLDGRPAHMRIAPGNQRSAHEFASGMAERGIIWHPSCANVSAAHTEEQIKKVLLAAEATLDDMGVV